MANIVQSPDRMKGVFGVQRPPMLKKEIKPAVHFQIAVRGRFVHFVCARKFGDDEGDEPYLAPLLVVLNDVNEVAGVSDGRVAYHFKPPILSAGLWSR